MVMATVMHIIVMSRRERRRSAGDAREFSRDPTRAGSPLGLPSSCGPRPRAVNREGPRPPPRGVRASAARSSAPPGRPARPAAPGGTASGPDSGHCFVECRHDRGGCTGGRRGAACTGCARGEAAGSANPRGRSLDRDALAALVVVTSLRNSASTKRQPRIALCVFGVGEVFGMLGPDEALVPQGWSCVLGSAQAGSATSSRAGLHRGRPVLRATRGGSLRPRRRPARVRHVRGH